MIKFTKLIQFCFLATLFATPCFGGEERTLIIGDSHAHSLREAVRERGGEESITIEGVSSSGLARLDFYNWLDRAEDLSAGEYNAIFIILGTNDGQNIPGNPQRIFGTDQWKILYMARVEKLITTLSKVKAPIYWVTIPPVASESLSNKTQYIQGLIDEVCLYHGVEKLDVSSLLARFPSEQNMAQKNDGVHLSAVGTEIVVGTILDELRHIFRDTP